MALSALLSYSTPLSYHLLRVHNAFKALVNLFNCGLITKSVQSCQDAQSYLKLKAFCFEYDG
eukprot:1293763-Amphidinium_carterae.1